MQRVVRKSEYGRHRVKSQENTRRTAAGRWHLVVSSWCFWSFAQVTILTRCVDDFTDGQLPTTDVAMLAAGTSEFFTRQRRMGQNRNLAFSCPHFGHLHTSGRPETA